MRRPGSHRPAAGPPRSRHDPAPARRTPPLRLLVRQLSTALLLAGVLVLVDVGLTLVWQEPVTGFIAKLRQGALADELDRLPGAGADPQQRRVLATLDGDPQRLAFLARQYKRERREGTAAARIRIPKIHSNHVVVWGTEAGDLQKGPGFYPSQPLPGAGGTAAIAGHRTTYLAPFRRVDRLRSGDAIHVDLPYGRFRYRVTHLRRVAPDATWVLERRRGAQLVLTACDPPFSAARRIVVFARLDRATIRRGARIPTS